MSKAMENIREYLVLMKERELKKLLAEVALSELIELWDSLNEQEELKIFTSLTIEQKVDLITSLALSKQEALITSLTGKSKAADVLKLIEFIEEKVYAGFGYNLEREILLIGEWSN